jgi:hypothetical protein
MEIDMNKKGFVSKIKNQLSKKKYLISTAYDSKGYWSSGVFTLNILGIPDLFHPVMSIVRNDRDQAESVHNQLVKIVETMSETEWSNHIPDPEPPDGFTDKADKIIFDEMLKVITQFKKILSHSESMTLFPESKMPAHKSIFQEALKSMVCKLLNTLKGNVDIEHEKIAKSLIDNYRDLYIFTADIVSDKDAELVNNFHNANYGRLNIKQFRDKFPEIKVNTIKITEIQQKVNTDMKNLADEIDQFIEENK